MNIKKALFCLVFLLTFTTALSAQAAGSDNRYLVKSNSQFLKKSFQVRHVFDSGFTANLTDWQLKWAKVFGVEVSPVKRLNILASAKAKPVTKIPTSQVGWGVKAIYGDDLEKDLPSGGKGINVAILDTGVVSHPDLKSQIAGCSDFSGVNPFTKNSCEDKNGHGTQVAGVVAANGGADGKGVYGVAPSAGLMIYKVCANDGTCFSDDVAVAIRYAVDNGANIIVLSLGSDTASALIDESIAYASDKGVMIIAAAGNDGPYISSIDYPASTANVISVGALDQAYTVPEWSARGAENKSSDKQAGDLEFVAPGVNIESTSNNNDYVTMSGTSMAAAHIAGLAAKEWQVDAKNPLIATRELLHKMAREILESTRSASGWGMPQL